MRLTRGISQVNSWHVVPHLIMSWKNAWG